MVAAKRTELSSAERSCGPPGSGSELWAAPWTPGSSVADGGGLVTPTVVWAVLERMAMRVLAAVRTGWVTIPALVRAS